MTRTSLRLLAWGLLPPNEPGDAMEHTPTGGREHQQRHPGRRSEDVTLKQIWATLSHLNKLIIVVAAVYGVWQGALAWIGYKQGTSPAGQIRELRAEIALGDTIATQRNRAINARVDTVVARFTDVAREIKALRYDICIQKQNADVCTRKIFLDDPSAR